MTRREWFCILVLPQLGFVVAPIVAADGRLYMGMISTVDGSTSFVLAKPTPR